MLFKYYFTILVILLCTCVVITNSLLFVLLCCFAFIKQDSDEIARDVSSDSDWDCSLHLPLWVPETEKASIEGRLEEWTEQLRASGADIASIAACLKKPLRPLWISQKTVIWLNEVPHHDSWDFTPVILVSASSSIGVSQHRTTSEFSWNYIPGAGDDEENWARGLSPALFWNHVYDLINSGPEVCNQKVADIVEKSRVRRSYRGESAPQIRVKTLKSDSLSHEEPSLASDISNVENDTESSDDFAISWLGSTNLAVGASQFGMLSYLMPFYNLLLHLFLRMTTPLDFTNYNYFFFFESRRSVK